MIDDEFGDDWTDFALAGAAIGFIEEELEEEKKRRRELDPDYDPIFNPDEEEPYP